MAGRRILYLLTLGVCMVFYVLYREWVAWVTLVGVLGLPILSLLVSLPAICTLKATLVCPEELEQGEPLLPRLETASGFPLPPVKYNLRIWDSLSGKDWKCRPKAEISTAHCGTRHIDVGRLWVYDYLGLWRFPGKRPALCVVAVLPKALPVAVSPEADARVEGAWRPKPGGGFSENHELRLYRPGDDLRNIHWKLVAKTGKLVLREPMEPVERQPELVLTLSGNRQVLDRKLGRLRFLGETLTQGGTCWSLTARTGNGVERRRVTNAEEAKNALLALLDSPATEGEELSAGRRQYRIGGEPYEG